MNKIAIVGIGRWGKNLIREFSKISIVSICTSKGDKNNLKWLKKNYPNVKYTDKLEKILTDKTINAIVIVTPIKTHYNLTIQALKSGKHVFVEKPIAENLSDAQKLIKLAKKQNLVLFVGHVFLYHPILQKIKTLTQKEQIKYARFDWVKLGAFEENIMLDLVSHDISIISELFGMPKKISLIDSEGHITNSDILTIKLEFSKNKRCVININRIMNLKRKFVTLITNKNLFLWDDNTLYKFNRKKLTFDRFFHSKKTPLSIECEEFIKSINNKRNLSNYKHAFKVIQILSKLIKFD